MRSTRAQQFVPRPLVVATMAAILGMAAAIPSQAGFDIPTGASPSPLFGATPFSQKMLMFEEFGTQPLPTNAAAHSLPDPLGCNGAADPNAYTGLLDQFLSEQ